jgi:tetratricopeptide (TPR) repeat protein
MRRIRVAIIAFSAALAFAGCHTKTPVVASPQVSIPPVPPRRPPAPPVQPGPEPLPRIEPPAKPVAPLEEADRAFIAGNYDEAERRYDKYLQDNPSGDLRDHALFHLGLIYFLTPGAPTERQRAIATFKQLIEEYPDSPFSASANLVLALHAQVAQSATDARLRDQKLKQLTTELDRLKKIDADRRKRP